MLNTLTTGILSVIRLFPFELVEEILYISLDLNAYVNVLNMLHKKGFAIKCLGNIGTFPDTSHLESMTLLERTSLSNYG